MTLTGSDLVAQALRRQGVDTFFYIMGAPMLSVEAASLALGMRGIDVRHEQAAAMAAHAYARLLNRPGICMAASGPGTTNLITGVAHAFVDCTPVVALGGSSPAALSGHGAFQEIDQLAMLAPCTKWSARVHHAERIPELVDRAIREAMSGKPGPVYLDLPGDVLFAAVDESRIAWPEPWDPARRPRPARRCWLSISGRQRGWSRTPARPAGAGTRRRPGAGQGKTGRDRPTRRRRGGGPGSAGRSDRGPTRARRRGQLPRRGRGAGTDGHAWPAQGAPARAEEPGRRPIVR